MIETILAHAHSECEEGYKSKKRKDDSLFVILYSSSDATP